MAKRSVNPNANAEWPPGPQGGRDVVLHTRVVTETGGGPDKTILMSASFLDHTNYWVAAAYMHPPDDPGFDAIRQRAAKVNCPLIGVPDRGVRDVSVIRQMLAICKNYNVRIWHGHDYKSNLLGLMLRPFWGMKFVTTLHGWVKNTSRTPLYYAVDRWCLPYYQHVFCVSDDLHEAAIKAGVPGDRASVLLNAIDEKTFSRKMPANQSPLRSQHGVPPGRLVIGAVGRLSAEKAFNNLIRATHTLVQAGRNVELWIAGEGDARPDLEKLIEQLGLSGRVKLMGFVSDTIGFYHALDLFVLSSLREGLPNVVLEAMAMEVPVVSTRVAGVPKLVTDGQTGLLVPIGDVDALSAAMSKAVTDAVLRRELSAAARSVIEKQFTFAQRMERERLVYDRVLGLDQSGQAAPTRRASPAAK